MSVIFDEKKAEKEKFEPARVNIIIIRCERFGYRYVCGNGGTRFFYGRAHRHFRRKRLGFWFGFSSDSIASIRSSVRTPA